jgi:hypothetical protein
MDLVTEIPGKIVIASISDGASETKDIRRTNQHLRGTDKQTNIIIHAGESPRANPQTMSVTKRLQF